MKNESISVVTIPHENTNQRTGDILIMGSFVIRGRRAFRMAFQTFDTARDIDIELSHELKLVGLIAPDTVWHYISRLKKSTMQYQVVFIRLTAETPDDLSVYRSLYHTLTTYNRFAVFKSTSSIIKDFYIVPYCYRMVWLIDPTFQNTESDCLVAVIVRRIVARAQRCSTWTACKG